MPNTKAAKELDEIEDYTIKIDMNEDGTMNMHYHIEWRVLDSTTEGPLEWVKIGVANKHVSKLTKKSDNIKKIKYVYDYGNYVRIDFKKKYYEGDVVSFDFSLTQSYMYQIHADGTCSYIFTPGWFSDIRVKKATVRWNMNQMQKCTEGATTEGNYAVWTKSLNKGQKMTVQATFGQNAFKLDQNKQVSNAQKGGNGVDWDTIYIIIVVIIIIIVFISSLRGGGGSYYRHSGFGYYPYHHHYYGGFGRGGFGGGRRRFIMCLCKLRLRLCLCRWRKSRMLKKGLLRNEFKSK